MKTLYLILISLLFLSGCTPKLLDVIIDDWVVKVPSSEGEIHTMEFMPNNYAIFRVLGTKTVVRNGSYNLSENNVLKITVNESYGIEEQEFNASLSDTGNLLLTPYGMEGVDPIELAKVK
ncbi:MAG: hypothetical protein ACJAS1_000818 [Oleiphilaceae bacterium]|jgi:hypothetical protein